MNRVLVWFSCGAASAIAAKLAVDKYGDRCEVLYCDTLAYEHPDNQRFLADVEQWLGHPIKLLKSEKYADIYDVFDKTGWLIGVGGARCTTELKKNVRKAYQRPTDIHVFGLTSDEVKRIERFEDQNADIIVDWVLFDNQVSKKECYRRLADAGIDLPVMYKLGYNNNNCIGCVKGQAGYWNKIRVDFPDAFDRMAKQERKMGVAINKSYAGDGKRKRVFLDELDPAAGRGIPLPDIECGALCVTPEEKPELLSIYDSVISNENIIPVQPVKQEPVAWMHTLRGDVQINKVPPECYGANWTSEPLYAAPVDAKAIRAERYFCQRCGKRIGDHNGVWDGIHTCTPPEDIRGLK